MLNNEINPEHTPSTEGNYEDVDKMKIKGELHEQTRLSFNDLKKALNGAKTLTPLYSALVGSPGIDSKDYTEKMQELITFNNKVSEKVYQTLVNRGYSDTSSSKAVIGRQVANFVGETWTVRNGELPDIDNLSNIISLSISSAPHVEEVFDDIEANSSRILSEMSIGLKIMPVTEMIMAMSDAKKTLYIGNLKTEQFISRTIDRVMSLSTYITNTLIDKNEITSKDEQIVLSSISSSIGSVVSSSMKNTLLTMDSEFRVMNSSDRQDYLKKMELHPEGVLLDRVIEQSSAYIDALYPTVNLIARMSLETDDESPSMGAN
jgi:hypothetical protein